MHPDATFLPPPKKDLLAQVRQPLPTAGRALPSDPSRPDPITCQATLFVTSVPFPPASPLKPPLTPETPLHPSWLPCQGPAEAPRCPQELP